MGVDAASELAWKLDRCRNGCSALSPKIMHRIWVDGTEFRWTREQATAAA